jgi:hypothetical protein
MRIFDIFTEDDKFDVFDGAKKLASSFKAGVDSVKSQLDKAETQVKKQQTDTEKKAKDAAALLSKQRLATIKQVVHSTLGNFIDSYADVSNANVNDLHVDDRPIQQKLLDASDTKEQLMVAALAYRDLGRSLSSIASKLDKEAAKLKKSASDDELAKIRKMNKASVNNSGVELVKRQREYFKRLIKLDNDFVMDEKSFIALMNAKMSQTPSRKLEATMLVASIIRNMSADLTDIAVTMAKEAQNKPSEKQK